MANKSEQELDGYTQELWDTIISIIHGFRTGIAADEGIDLTFPQTMLLLELQRAGRCSMGELSQRLRITQGVATRMVDLLVEKGLVERHRAEADRRLVLVAPTQKGAAIAREMERVNRRKMGELFAGTTPRERDELLGFLKRLRHQFEERETGR